MAATSLYQRETANPPGIGVRRQAMQLMGTQLLATALLVTELLAVQSWYGG
ncbi:hypothetical protein N9N28_03450 [Rubripirellula amarantea]|uniref:hypothetical protein n=1 Tax=Rubripirellula amarantea TaxID=2527999 RepID=UPI0013EF44E1|nr:hypothetical protein [Rubripirellula amarantea]MDA8743670.1 hypothetical protein [Rubripirellula amarantea]